MSIVPRPASRNGPMPARAAATAPSTLNSSGPRRSSTLVSRIGFMNSFAGSGEYSSTSTGPSRSARERIAPSSASASRMSAAAKSAVIPSSFRTLASSSSLAASRATSPTLIPSRPNRRATAAPRLGPAPTITIDICCSSLRRRAGVVLLVSYVSAPGHRAAGLVGLLDRDVGHEAVGRGAVPVVLAGLEEDAVAGADLLDRPALVLAQPDPLGDEDRLPDRVGVPGGTGAGGEVDVRGGGAPGRRDLGDGVDVDVAGEPVGGPLLRRQ